MNEIKYNDQCKKKYIFVCGLHRSGTTIIARLISQFKQSTAFFDTGVLMDEGQYLQEVYPTTEQLGGVGVFGFKPKAHLTESSPLLTEKNIMTLRSNWENVWEKDKEIYIEKTPANVIATRFLQKAFPNSYFIVIKRHPIPVSLATQKWCCTPLHNLLDHWLRCYEAFEEDKKYLRNVYELAYESFVENPSKYLDEIAKFIGTDHEKISITNLEKGHNKKYFAKWVHLLTESFFKHYFHYIALKYEGKFHPYKYSLLDDRSTINTKNDKATHYIGYMYYIMADLFIPIRRFMFKTKIIIMRLVRPKKEHYPKRIYR